MASSYKSNPHYNLCSNPYSNPYNNKQDGCVQPLATAELLPVIGKTAMYRLEQGWVERQEVGFAELMQRAAEQISLVVLRQLAGAKPSPKIVICCGAGNNGGDGYLTAIKLRQYGLNVTVIEVLSPHSQLAITYHRKWQKTGCLINYQRNPALASATIKGATIIIDAIFGIGLSRQLEQNIIRLIRLINVAPALKLCIDIPSGMDADSGNNYGAVVDSTITVCFQLIKVGVALRCTGQMICVPIHSAADYVPQQFMLTQAAAKRLLPQRRHDAHKGSFGHALIIGGSTQMPGAVALAGRAALRSGVGLLSVAMPRQADQSLLPAEIMRLISTKGSADYFSVEQIPNLSVYQALGLGCGVGRNQATAEFVAAILQRCRVPLVLDADGINLVTKAQLKECQQPLIITPHPGELGRLCGVSSFEIEQDRVRWAQETAIELGVHLILKGLRTLIATPTNLYINTSGDEGLATGGSGDVLTGLLTGLLAQGMGLTEACLLGVYLHGLARTIQPQISSFAFTASDAINGIDKAFKALSST